MRNFWLTADIDGRKTELAGGPRHREGGMFVEIRQRDEGSSVVACHILCYSAGDMLVTAIYDSNGKRVASFKTKR